MNTSISSNHIFANSNAGTRKNVFQNMLGLKAALYGLMTRLKLATLEQINLLDGSFQESEIRAAVRLILETELLWEPQCSFQRCLQFVIDFQKTKGQNVESALRLRRFCQEEAMRLGVELRLERKEATAAKLFALSPRLEELFPGKVRNRGCANSFLSNSRQSPAL